MRKSNILECEFDSHLGISYIKKHCKYGTFDATSFCDSQDKDIMNQWDGCRFAEWKTDIAIQKEKAKVMRNRAKGAIDLTNLVSNDIKMLGEKSIFDMEQLNRMRKYADSMDKVAKVETEKFEKMRDELGEKIEKALEARRALREKEASSEE